MRIVQVITALNLGGAQTLLEILSYGLQNAGMEVTVLSLEDNHSAIAKRIEEQGIPVIYLDKRPHYDSTITKKLGNVLKTIKPDIIHAHNIKKAYVYLAARKAGVKRIVYTVHNMAWKEQNLVGGIFSYFMFHTGCMVPVGISPNVTESIRERYHLKSVLSIYNGTDLSRYHKKQSYSFHPKMRIINVARLDAQKNQKRLIDAFHIVLGKFPDIELILVGEGDLREELEKQVLEKGLKDSVFFEGMQEDIPGYLYESDIFCLSSDYEGMPMTLIEAMASGLPIVSTAVGGITDMLQNERSALLTKLSTKEMADALIRLLEDESLRMKLGKNPSRDVKQFSHTYMARRYISLYKKICNNVRQ